VENFWFNSGSVMTEPRKKKSHKTGRPLEGVPMRKLVKRVKDELHERIKIGASEGQDKPKQD
jgi:hypothetical protein